MSIIEHAQMLPTASLYSRNHPLGAGMRRPTFNFAIENRRSSSPAGNSSQSSTGVPAFPVTPDADLPPSLGGPLLKEMSTPEDIHGLSGGSSVTMGSVSFIGAGTGLVGLNASRGRSFTTPSSPTPITVALLPDDDEPMPTKPRPAEARYSGGNFSYPTRAALSNEDGAQKSDMKRLAPPRGLQPLTLPGVVAAGGRLSPRAGGTFALPSSPSLIATKPTTTPKKSNLPLPGGATSKSSGNIATAAPTSYGSRSRSGSTNSNSGIAPLTPTTPSNLKSSTAARKNGTLPPRSRTLSGAGNGILGPNAVPPTASSIATPKRTLGNLRSIVTGKTLAAAATADVSGVPKTLGVARATSAPGSPRARFGAPSPSGKTGAGMAYRKSAGAVNVMAEASTPARSGLPPPSASRLMAPGSLIRPASQQSLTPSVVGVAL